MLLQATLHWHRSEVHRCYWRTFWRGILHYTRQNNRNMKISCFHSDVGLYCVKWHRNLLLLFQYWLHGFPALFTDTLLSISVFYNFIIFFYFSSFYFSVPRGRLNCWLFRAHFKTASRTVSYTSHRSYHYFSSQPNHALIKLTGRDCLDKTGPTKKARCGNFHSFSTRRSPSIRAATARRTGAVVITNWLSRTARKRQSTLIFAELLYRSAVQNGSPPTANCIFTVTHKKATMRQFT